MTGVVAEAGPAPEPLDRATALVDDVLAEPATLATLLDAYGADGGPLSDLPRHLGARPVPRLVLSGLGSSRYAALDAATELRSRGVDAAVEYASSDAPAPPARGVVFVAISASGGTPEVVAAAERHRRTSLVVAVTNDPASALASSADVVLPLLAGTERSGVASRTYQATVAVLGLLVSSVADGPGGDGGLRGTPDALGRLLAGRSAWLEGAGDLLDRAGLVGVIAPASMAGAAEQGALMLREGPRLVATAHETVDWTHTAIYTALPGFRAIVIGGAGDGASPAPLIAGRGGEVLAIGSAAAPAAITVDLPIGPAIGRASRSILTAAVFELLAAEVWGRAAGRLKEP